MNLRFTFASATLRSYDRLQDLIDELKVTLEQEHFNDLVSVSPESVSPEIKNQSVSVFAEIQTGANSDSADRSSSESEQMLATENTIRIVQILSDLSERHTTLWRVGHDHESDLGTIEPGELNDSLIEEIRMSIRVAYSLSELNIDDEFVEADPLFLSETTKLSAEDSESWTGLLDSDDEFIRFPEFDS